MAKVITDDKHYKAIADSIRFGWYQAFGVGTTATYKPEDMAEVSKQMMRDCYSAGHSNGYNNGYSEGSKFGYDMGLVDGKAQGYNEGKAEGMSSFWDVFQKNGSDTGVNYYYAFAYSDRFTDENYNPKYDIICSKGNSPAIGLFYSNQSITNTKVPIRVLGDSLQGAFYSCKYLHTIPLLEVHEAVSFTSTFGACNALVEIRFAGTIGKDIDFGACKNLSIESLVSIVEHLSTTSTGKTITFSSDCITKYYISANDFSALTHGHENWTFALV